VGGGAVAIVLAAALSSAFVWPGFADPKPAAFLADTSGFAVATVPSLTPAERIGDQTELVKAMPDTVGAYAQTNIAGTAGWQGGEGAIESWRFTYADSLGPGATNIVVDIGQWGRAAEAEEFFATLLDAESQPVAQGDVEVKGERSGRFALVEVAADAGQGRQGALYWRNGTVVFRVTGPIEKLQQFYSNFPI